MAEKTGIDTSKWTAHGRNVRFTNMDGFLFIAVDTRKAVYNGLTPTPKGNVTIASTLGNVDVGVQGLKMGLNLYGKPV